MITVLPKSVRLENTNPESVLVIDTTSHSKSNKDLSPFYLGPVKLYGGRVAHNVENAWQFSKVYQEFTDAAGNATVDYWRWAEEGWADTYAHRYPMGKGKVPLYSLWDGMRLDYISARREIYAPLYAGAVTAARSFLSLYHWHRTGRDLILLDFDAYDHRGLGMTYRDVVRCKERKMGHAFVLAMLLEGVSAWQ